MMRYLSVCSGIEAATVAWHPLGWTPAAFSEIDKFPRAVLAHHYPTVPLHGDFTTIRGDEYGPIDLLVGGTPCQDFSIAGLRAGVAGDRGNLTLEFLRLAARTRPRWLVWENVPGSLSSVSHAAPDPCPPPPPVDMGCDGAEVETEDDYRSEELHALNCFLAGLSELGYGFAYRVLDAQYFGLAQRRARVFVVGYLGDWRRAAAVLFERESLLGNSPPSREARERVAGTITAGAFTGGAGGRVDGAIGGHFHAVDVCPTLRAGGNETGGDRPPGTDVDTADSLIVMSSGQANAEISSDQSPSLTCLHEAPIVAHAFKPSHFTRGKDGAPSELAPQLSADADKGDQDTVIAFDPTQITHPENRSQPRPGQPSPTLAPTAHPPSIAFTAKDHGADATEELSPTLRSGDFDKSHANGGVMPAVAFSSRHKGDDGRGYERPPQSYVEHVGALDTVTRHAVAFESRVARNGRGAPDVVVPPLKAESGTNGKGDGAPLVMAFADVADPIAANQARSYTREGKNNFRMSNVARSSMQVRRLTPRECERLQGFPDDYTLIPYGRKKRWVSRSLGGEAHAVDRGPALAADGPRYKALGNSMAVPVMRWIGERIAMIERIASGSQT